MSSIWDGWRRREPGRLTDPTACTHIYVRLVIGLWKATPVTATERENAMTRTMTRLVEHNRSRLLIGLLAAMVLAGSAPTARADRDATAISHRPTAPGHPEPGPAGGDARLVHDALRVVFSERRVDQVDRYFAADFVQYSPYATPGGREELKAWWAGIVHSIPDVTTTVTATRVQGTDVVTFRTVQGTIMRDLPQFGIKGCGQRVQVRIADIFRVRRHKIIAHWEVADTGPFVLLAGRPC
ncbi:ester cyclase [Actinomadura fulvescens]